MFLCLYVTSNGYLKKKITERNTQYSRTGKQGGKEMRLTNHFLKTNVMSNLEAEYFSSDVYGIICGFGIYTLLNYLKIHPAKPMHQI